MQEEVFLKILKLFGFAENVSSGEEISDFRHLVPLSVFETSLEVVFAGNVDFPVVVINEGAIFELGIPYVVGVECEI